MNQITIGKPYIVEEENFTRLESVIIGPDFKKIHYFEVQKEYGKYLCYERSDAFVVSLFYFAMTNGYNIVCETPMSERLYFQLSKILMPAMVKYHSDIFYEFSIIAPLESSPIKNAKAVGTAVSGGVDSFYTIISNMDGKVINYNITHLLIANSFNIYRGDKDTRERFKKLVQKSEIIAKELGLPLIQIYTNHSEFWFKNYQNIFCLKYASYPLALQRLFSIYYFSSGYEYSEFQINAKDLDSSHYDALTVPTVCNENFIFYLYGGEASRNKKIQYIADNNIVQRRLQVCNLQLENCSKCEKCMRTQMSLYAINKLELFSASFDISKFYENKDRTLIRMLTVRGPFDQSNLETMKENGIGISKLVIIRGKIGRLYFLIKQLLKKIRILVIVSDYLIRKDPNSMLKEIEKYNTDKDFARQCDSKII